MEITAKEKIEGFRLLLKVIEEGVKDLHKDGIQLVFTIASEHKTVEVKSNNIFEIQVKATINQEI